MIEKMSSIVTFSDKIQTVATNLYLILCVNKYLPIDYYVLTRVCHQIRQSVGNMEHE